jgi:transcriptional regulator with XRE-family HTH domain
MFSFIGERLVTLRKKSGITQEQLAEFLNVDQSFISKCEKSERQPSTDMLEKLSNLFGCPVKFFMDSEYEYLPMEYAFRSNGIEIEDFESISVMNKIALNLNYMERILAGE